ncbi:MAG TPA: glutathione S-transferase family protein [Sandaracinaceae bacterium LLY-WYZ-13_1]|nr:glutathione S-transferase family protein [Sandaracinaceae bacterium LLY-WYZ-13_1]
MGLLVEGEWQDRWYDTKSTGGRFVRQKASFRDWVRADDPEHPAEAGRYHLYVSYACPWAHRTLIYRKLLGLEDALSVSVVHPDMLDRGWEFRDGCEDAIHGARYLYEVYLKADPQFTGRVTVPVLWDKKKQTIVNNESSEIIRMLDEEFGVSDPNLRPEALRAEIDEINPRVYDQINNGVYKAGFATTQEAYDEAVSALFGALDWLEEHLEGKTYLVGERLTEADVRLFTTLVRFDPVYHHHFKCSRRRLRDYPNLWALTRRVYQTEGVADTVHMDHIRRHYFYSHESINPHRIVPIAPEIDFDAPVAR